MFDLEQSVNDWRNRLTASDGVDHVEADEIEEHLRDSYEALKQQQLADDEAFLVATRRIGTPEELSLEFSKINGARIWCRRAQWMLAGYLLISLIALFRSAIDHCLTLLAIQLEFPLWATFVISGTAAVSCVVLLVYVAGGLASGRTWGLATLTTHASGFMRNTTRSGSVTVIWLVVGVTVLFACSMLAGGVMSVAVGRIMTPADLGAVSIVRTFTGQFGHLAFVGSIVATLCWLVRGEVTSSGPRSISFAALMLLAVGLMLAFGLLSLGVEPLVGDWPGLARRM